MQLNNILYIALGTGLVLLIPLISMQFTNEVQWTGFDFVVAGILLFTTGLVFNCATRRFPKYRVLVGAIILAVFLYIWAELAVGIFTNLGS